MENQFTLVLWPESQNLMEYSWFRNECVLYQTFDGEEDHDSAYLVPNNRMEEINSGNTNNIIDDDIDDTDAYQVLSDIG